MKPFLKILKFAFHYKHLVILNVILNVLSVIFGLFSITLVIPLLGILFGTQEQLIYRPTGEISLKWLKDFLSFKISSIIQDDGLSIALGYICISIVVAFLFKNLFIYLAKLSIIPIRTGITRYIRMILHNKLSKLSISYFSEKRKGDIMSRIISDVSEVEISIMKTLSLVVHNPINIIFSISLLMSMSTKLTLVMLLLFPFTGLIIGSIGKSLKKKSLKGQIQISRIISSIEETISGLRVIKAFQAEKQIINKFDDELKEHQRIMSSIIKRRDLASPLSEFLSTMVMVVIIWYGGNLIFESQLNSNKPELTPQTFIGFIIIFSQILPPIKSLSEGYYSIQRGSASAERILDILNTEIEIKDKKKSKPLVDFQHSIRIEKGFFSYNQKPILQNISIEVKKGKTLALVGQSGGGKTTIANLMARFYDLNKGQLFIDGIDIREYKIADLRKQMAIVTQDPILFHDTILNNIALGIVNPDKEMVIKAAKIANAHEFISQFEDGYNHNIGDGGQILSGGEKQRISIARAVMKNPSILILDEATSALDNQSERLVQEAINKLMNNRTSIVIAHRLSTIQKADEIIVLNQGKIVEKGTHESLLALNKFYFKLHQMQNQA